MCFLSLGVAANIVVEALRDAPTELICGSEQSSIRPMVKSFWIARKRECRLWFGARCQRTVATRPGVQAGRFPENREFNREFSIFRLVQQEKPARGRARLQPGPGRVRTSSGPANAASLLNALPEFCRR
jgi:hypothetical protein